MPSNFETSTVKILRFYIIYRLPIILALIVGGVLSHLFFDTVLAWLCYIAAFISLLLYFMMGTMRIVQEAVQEGDVEQARAYLKMIRFPKLLFKPIRMGYYMLQSNLDLATDDLESAEANIRQRFVELRKGNTKEARKHLQEALKAGIPDKDSLAATHLQLCSMEIQRQQYRIAKEHFKKAKAAKPRNEEIVKQIQMLEKQIPRLPG